MSRSLVSRSVLSFPFIEHLLLLLSWLAALLSRCTQIPEFRLFVFNLFPGYKCIFPALESRITAHKTRTKFVLKFVRDISAQISLHPLYASVSFRDLGTNR